VSTIHRTQPTTRYTATFHPQAWINDYAVEIDHDGPNQWDCTEAFAMLRPDYRAEMLAAIEADGVALDAWDHLKGDPAARPGVRVVLDDGTEFTDRVRQVRFAEGVEAVSSSIPHDFRVRLREAARQECLIMTCGWGTVPLPIAWITRFEPQEAAS